MCALTGSSTLDAFTGEELAGLLTSRKAARIVLMRGTIHLVTAKDCHRLRPLVQPALDRMLRTNATHGKALGVVDVTAVVDAAKRLLDAGALTPGEVGARLAEQWPGTPPGSLAEAARSLLPLVEVPPRALWQRSAQVRLTTATAWLGKPRGKALTIDDLMVRYLAAFGPASTADVQTWSGLSRLGEVIERLAPQLIRFKSERDRYVTICPMRRVPTLRHRHRSGSSPRSTTSCCRTLIARASSATSTARASSHPRTALSPAHCSSTATSPVGGNSCARAKPPASWSTRTSNPTATLWTRSRPKVVAC